MCWGTRNRALPNCVPAGLAVSLRRAVGEGLCGSASIDQVGATMDARASGVL